MADSITHALSSQQVIWILYRGDNKASIAVPWTFHTGEDVYPADTLSQNLDEQIKGGPLNRVLQEVETLLRRDGRFQALAAIPQNVTGAKGINQSLSDRGWADVSNAVEPAIRDLGLETTFGQWADTSQSKIYLYRRIQAAGA